MQFQVMTGVPVTPVTAMCAVVTVYAIVAVGPVDGVTTQFGGLRYGAANVIVGVAADAVQLPEKSPIGAAGGEQFDSESDVGPAPAGCPWIVGFTSRKPVCAYAAADANAGCFLLPCQFRNFHPCTHAVPLHQTGDAVAPPPVTVPP